MYAAAPGVVLSAVRIVLMLSLTLAASGAGAQGPVAARDDEPSASPLPSDSAPLPERYTRAARLGFQEYELGNYVEARARFREAHEVYANARSLRLLGKVEYDLKHYRASIRYLEEALGSNERPLDADLRADVQGLLELARSYVATYTVALSPEVAQLEVDGSSVRLDADRRIDLEVGEHTLYAHAEGYRPLRKVVEIVAGHDATVELRLEGLPADTSHRTVGTSGAQADVSRKRRRRWLISSVVVAVLAGTATAVALSQRGTRVEDTDGGNTNETLVANF